MKKTIYKAIMNIRRKLNYRIMRPMIQHIKDTGGHDLVGVEIGSYIGENAYNILTYLPIKRLYIVDPYVPYEGFICDDMKTKNDFSSAYKIAKKRLSGFDNVTFIRKYSVDAVKDVPDNLDFVYIDGNHDYEYVKQDTELWYPKVKKGGVIGGHDMGHLGVTKFFLEFAPSKDYHVKLCDWWIKK